MDSRSRALLLMSRREEIEAEIKEHQKVLQEYNIGMSEPLIDNEGFPRSDIDIYQVRQSRQRIICLQNDYKDIMKEIEQQIHAFHAEERMDFSDTPYAEKPEESQVPFATVGVVDANSPAEKANLHSGDSIIKFGSITSENFSGLPSILNIVQHSIQKPIRVKVQRNQEILQLTLTPQEWNGKGLLGCSVIPATR